ncbi:hypothetical protein GCM10023259_087040 [Thermocatellispora tengchongensis]
MTGNDVERVRELLGGGAAADPAPGEDASTPLYLAAVGGDAEIVRLLLAHGADPNRLSGGEDEGLPLCAAAAWNHVEVAEALLAAGADPRGKEGDGWSALLWAATNGHHDVAAAVLAAGADADDANDAGDTALTLAARRGAPGVVRALLDAGADPELADGDGDTALAIAEDWLGVHLEAALLEQLEEEIAESGERDVRPTVTRAFTGDGTELVRVSGGGAAIEAQRGHAAVATLLEAATGTYVPVPDLVRRALAHRDTDRDHETWWVIVDALGARGDEETLEAAVGLCTSDDTRERELGADVLSRLAPGEDGDAAGVAARAVPVLRRMVITEGSEAVLDSVLNALGRYGDPATLPDVLDIVRRPGRTPTPADPVALAAVLPPAGEDGHAEAVDLLIEMSRDPDPEVRDWATLGLAGVEAGGERVREALAARLEDPSLTAVAEAARGLAALGDERAAAGVRRVLAESDDDYARERVAEAAEKLGISPESPERP